MTPAEYKALLAEARDVEDPNDQEQVRRAEGKKHALEQWWEARVNEYLKTFKVANTGISTSTRMT